MTENRSKKTKYISMNGQEILVTIKQPRPLPSSYSTRTDHSTPLVMKQRGITLEWFKIKYTKNATDFVILK